MLVRPFGVVLGQSPLGRHKVTGDQVSEVEREGTQFLPDLLVQFFRGDVRSECGEFLPLDARALLPTTVTVVAAIAGTGARSFPTGGTVTVPEGTTATVVPLEPGTVTPVAATRAIIPVEGGTVVTAERPALTAARPGAVPAPNLITVRPTLTAIATVGRRGTVITIGRGTAGATIAIEPRTVTPVTTTRTVVPVEPRTVTPVTTTRTIVPVVRRTVTPVTTARTVVPVVRRTVAPVTRTIGAATSLITIAIPLTTTRTII
ncbi:hypothetical protein FHS43_006485, partial [Streptosporangium becharense]